MSFDHTAAIAQVDANVQYVGVDCSLSGRSGSFKAILTEETGNATLEDYGTSEVIEAFATVSVSDFESAPKFGALLTVTATGRKYRVRHSERQNGTWRVQLHSTELSTPPPEGTQFPV